MEINNELVRALHEVSKIKESFNKQHKGEYTFVSHISSEVETNYDPGTSPAFYIPAITAIIGARHGTWGEEFSKIEFRLDKHSVHLLPGIAAMVANQASNEIEIENGKG